MLFGKFNNTIKKYNLLEGGETVVVGVSGGVDSMTLLHLLGRFVKKSAGKLVMAHLHHGLRGDEADRDEAFLRNVAKKTNLPLLSRRMNVKRMAAADKLNLHDAARKARYNFFNDVLKEVGGDRIAVGHNADDQAETVMMRIIRGTGIKGLAAIPPERGTIIRPLIDLTRDEITSYAVEHGIGYVEDSSNRDTGYMRNRLRHELMPILKKYNPAVCRELNLLSSMARDMDYFISNEAAREFNRLVRAIGPENDFSLDVTAFNQLPSSLKGKVIFLGLERISGSQAGFYSSHIKNIEALISDGRSGLTVNLPGKISAFIEYGKVVFTRSHSENRLQYSYNLNVSGETIIPEAGIKLSAEKIDFYYDMINSSGRNVIYIDMRKIPSPLKVRNFRDGDRIRLRGMKGRKKVKDFFIDEKIPRRIRKNVPILVSGDEIQWIVGYRDGGSLLADMGTINALKVAKV